MISRIFLNKDLRNVLAIYSVQALNLVTPLLLIPTLNKKIGISGTGSFFFAQSFAFIASIVLEYGFMFSGSRDIATSKSSKDKEYIFFSILSAKIILAACVMPLSVSIYFISPIFHNDPLLLFFSTIYAIGLGFSPSWFFQGIQNLKLSAVIEAGARISALLAIVLLKIVDNTVWIMFFFALSSTISSLILNCIIMVNFRKIYVSFSDGFQILKDSWGTFFYRAFTSLYTTANVFVLGFFASSAEIGIYGSAERLISTCIAMFWPVWRVYSPKISILSRADTGESKSFIIRFVLIMSILSLLIASLVFYFSPLFLTLFIPAFTSYDLTIFRILALSVGFMGISGTLGISILIPFREEVALNKVTVVSAISSLVLTFIFVPIYKSLAMAVIVLSIEAFIVLILGLVTFFKGRAIFASGRG